MKIEYYKELERQYISLEEENKILKKKVKQMDNGHFNCPICNSRLIWSSDHDMEDIYESEGIVSFYHCNNCPQLEIEVRLYDEEEI